MKKKPHFKEVEVNLLLFHRFVSEHRLPVQMNYSNLNCLNMIIEKESQDDNRETQNYYRDILPKMITKS